APCPCRRRAAGWKASTPHQPRHAALMSGEAQAPLQPSLAHAGRPYRSAELNAVGACSAWLLPHTASDADLGAAADAQRHALGDTVTGVTADTTTDTHRHAQAKRRVAAEAAKSRNATQLAKFSDGGGVSICHYCGRAASRRCVWTSGGGPKIRSQVERLKHVCAWLGTADCLGQKPARPG
ncbi:MAG: hypothetical protein ACPIOQ_40600, partial [Promethearchaeia archaeon]